MTDDDSDRYAAEIQAEEWEELMNDPEYLAAMERESNEHFSEAE